MCEPLFCQKLAGAENLSSPLLVKSETACPRIQSPYKNPSPPLPAGAADEESTSPLPPAASPPAPSAKTETTATPKTILIHRIFMLNKYMSAYYITNKHNNITKMIYSFYFVMSHFPSFPPNKGENPFNCHSRWRESTLHIARIL